MVFKKRPYRTRETVNNGYGPPNSRKILPMCPGLERWVSARESQASLGMENVNPLSLNYNNFEIKGFSVKDMGITVFY